MFRRSVSPEANRWRSRRSAGRVGRSCLAVVAGLASGAVVATAASGAVARPSTKTVKPDFAFYVGKKVTFITGGSPGGANDELAVELAPLMSSYLHCTVIVEDVPAGATVPAQDDTAAAPADGLTFGQMGPIGNVENEIQNIPDINFHMLTAEYIGGVSAPEYVIATLPSSGIRTLAQLVKDRTQTSFLALSGGGQLTESVLIKAYAMNSHLLTGYPNGSSLALGFLRGDGTASVINPSSISNSIQAGQVKPLAMISPYTKGAPAYSVLSKLPTLSEYIAANPPKSRAGRNALKVLLTFDESSNQVLFAPQGTPPARIAALSAAFHSALAQPGVQSALINAGVPNGYFSATQVREQIQRMVKEAPELLPFL